MSRRALLCLLLSALALGCRRDEGAVGSPASPFVMVISPAHAAPAERLAALERFVSEQSGLAFQVRIAKDAEEAVRMAGSPNNDAGLLPLFEYLFAQKLYGVEAGLQVVRKGGAKSYQGEVVTRAEGGPRTLAELAGKKIAYVDRYSTTGFLLAAKKLADAGVRVEPVFAGSHAAALEALRNGRVSAAAVYAGAARGDTSLASIATTETIPNEPVFFRAGLDPEKRRRVSEALIAFAQSEEGRAVLAEMADVTGFEPAGSADYAAAFALIQSAGKSVRDLVPRGWLVANERERSPQDLAP
jgi:phosphonate transport system substrate-binding protein